MNRKIKKVREYCNNYRGSKEQVKRHVCRTSYTDRKHLKKKNRFNERKCADKLYQQRFNKAITFAKRR